MYSTMLAALLVAAAAGAATALPTRGMTPAMTLDSSVRCALSLHSTSAPLCGTGSGCRCSVHRSAADSSTLRLLFHLHS